MINLKSLYSVYLDRAFQQADRHATDDGELLDWYCEGDIERVNCFVELAEALVDALPKLGDVPLSTFCYEALEFKLSQWLLSLYTSNTDAPGNTEIIERVKELHAQLELQWRSQ